LPALSDDVVAAQALFRLGQALIRRGDVDEGNRRIRDASRLHPDSWCIWRQGAPVTEDGLAAQADFWRGVDSPGERRYYARVEMAGMP